MSTRNFDSRVIMERLQQKNYAKQVYDRQVQGQAVIHQPQTSSADASMIAHYQAGTQTTYTKGLLGGCMTRDQSGTC